LLYSYTVPIHLRCNEHILLSVVSTDPYVRVTTILPSSTPSGTSSAAAAAAVVGINRSAAPKRKRKKTTTKRQTSNPVWNEALVFSVERSALADIRVELTVFDDGRQPLGTDEPLGEVAIGHGTTGDELAHWNEVLSQKPVASRWHRLQQPVATTSTSGP
jgi:C2 domain